MAYNEDDFLMISGIQHYAFCARQWALIHMEQVWEDNHFTVQGAIMHDIAHDIYRNDKRKGVVTSRAMPIFSARLGVCGECDIVEFVPDEHGAFVPQLKANYTIQPIEYKLGEPKEYDCDILQLTAQTVCLEEMLNCTIDRASLFYNKTKKRLVVNIDLKLKEELSKIISEMHYVFYSKIIPKAIATDKCRACSLKDICMSDASDNKMLKRYLK